MYTLDGKLILCFQQHTEIVTRDVSQYKDALS